MQSSARFFTFRIAPHADLKKSIIDFARAHAIEAGVVVSCVGSLEQYNIRFANKKEGTSSRGFFEILSLSGTVSPTHSHLHISISDEHGKVFGGHLLENNLIYTTAELVVAALPDLSFTREVDPTYGYKELVVKKMG